MTTKKSIVLSSVFCAGLVCGGALFAQRPVTNINPQKHPYLAEAQRHLQEAWGKADEAQKENKEGLGGHAQKAKEHMEAADQELKAAAEYADHH